MADHEENRKRSGFYITINSYAFIGIDGLKAKQRNIAFEKLYSEGRIKEINVEGL